MMSDGLFHHIEDAQVVVRYASGSYRQVKLYRRDKDGKASLYAGVGGGFIMLLGRGGTSAPSVAWEHIHGANVAEGYLGRPQLVDA